ncbi:elongin A, like [Genypterus blacodes]|uniref:elongin A, like n=1 Tax=Genypterus blacodes TaxID=154954 RepID=UPI003F7627FB
MASGADLVKKVQRFKMQLKGPAEPATVLQILQKLKDLDITLDVLAETGIGKTVNCLRKDQKVGELAKSLVRYWKQMVPKESRSYTTEEDASLSMSLKDKLDDQDCPNYRSLTIDKPKCLTPDGKTQDTSNELSMRTVNKKGMTEKQQDEEQQRHEVKKESCPHATGHTENQSEVMKKREEYQEDETSSPINCKKKNNDGSCGKSGSGDTVQLATKTSDTHQKSRHVSREKSQSSCETAITHSEKKPQPRSKSASKEVKAPVSFESSDKYSKTSLKHNNVKSERPSRRSDSSEAHNKKRKKPGTEKHLSLKDEQEPGNTRNKRARTKCKDGKSDEPSMSFECCLNYDLNAPKRRERTGAKNPCKKIKNAEKEPAKHSRMKPAKASVTSVNIIPAGKTVKDSLLDLINIPLPEFLPECDNPSTVDTVELFERKVERVSEFGDVSEESSVFTGQRLNKKMQVYSGAKTLFLPAMMSLYQQCIRTLQNNINLLYETGGVPFEILEPVLERCTPEQLLRMEEFNPIYVGVTDHLWGRHCQRDFRSAKLQEYESWKEMYVRLSEERERKLQRLTRTIVSSHSRKPKGRQVKMAFIHTVAKPPRDVRIQQEIHGTAVQPPHQLRCSFNVPENRSKPSCNEPNKSSTISSGASSIQDPRKKTRVAPMMAKSLKAFKKQLGRR